MKDPETMAFEDAEIKAASNLLFYGKISTSYERIFRDAIISYQEILMFGVPDKETHDNICARAALANLWLIEHGYKEEPFDDKMEANKMDTDTKIMSLITVDCSNATSPNDSQSQAEYELATGGPIDFVHSPYETPSIARDTAVNNSQPTDKNEENCQ